MAENALEEDLVNRIGHWSGGKLVAGDSGRTGPVFDPAVGARTGEVDLASVAEVDAVVAVAKAASLDWRRSSLSRRAGSCSVSASSSMPTGRGWPRWSRPSTARCSDAMGEVARGIKNVEFACGIPHLLKGEHSEQVSTGVDVRTLLQPVGVVAGISSTTPQT
jgi:malonate-semialdehyde dehydrogenase (acetylating)/methylmalonate-semialdehyde dehydrogenase